MVEFWVVLVLRSLEVIINCKLYCKKVNFFRITGILFDVLRLFERVIMSTLKTENT